MLRAKFEVESLLEVAADKRLSFSAIAKQSKMAPATVERIFHGQKILLGTATKFYHALGKDPRLKIIVAGNNG